MMYGIDNCKHGVILMTALVPTKGHQHLVRFAHDYLDMSHDDFRLTVVISTRSHEPTSFNDRANALREIIHSDSGDVEYVVHMDDNAPQNPSSENDPEFWEYWKETVIHSVHKAWGARVEKVDYIFASETYGNDMAKKLECDFVPVDVKRDYVKISGTKVRNDLFNMQHMICDKFIRQNQTNVVLFGQESVGKTITAKAMATLFNGQFYPEWARQYLETVGSELTPEKMKTIRKGQIVQENMSRWSNKFINVFDTDFLSTYGYYKLLYEIYGKQEYLKGFNEIKHLSRVRLSYRKKNTLYVLLSDNIPFVPDCLRYGGDKRETTMDFWENILKEMDANYVICNEKNLEHRTKFIESEIHKFNPKYNATRDFKRE